MSELTKDVQLMWGDEAVDMSKVREVIVDLSNDKPQEHDGEIVYVAIDENGRYKEGATRGCLTVKPLFPGGSNE